MILLFLLNPDKDTKPIPINFARENGNPERFYNEEVDKKEHSDTHTNAIPTNSASANVNPENLNYEEVNNREDNHGAAILIDPKTHTQAIPMNSASDNLDSITIDKETLQSNAFIKETQV